jgi:hypothetical protein
MAKQMATWRLKISISSGFPAGGGNTRASLAFGDKSVQSLEVYPSLRGLLTGNLDISRVEVASPALSVRLPEPGEEPFNIDEIEGQIRALLASMASAIPGMAVTVSGGSAEVRIGDRPMVMITGLDGRLVAPPGEMNLQFSSRANVFDSLRVEGRINGETLTTKGQIKVENLRLEESMASLLPWLDDYVESGKLNLNLSLTLWASISKPKSRSAAITELCGETEKRRSKEARLRALSVALTESLMPSSNALILPRRA